MVDGEENDRVKLIKSERSQKHSDSSRLYLDKLLKHIICIQLKIFWKFHFILIFNYRKVRFD